MAQPQRFASLADLLRAQREGALPADARVILDEGGAFVDGDFEGVGDGEEILAAGHRDLLAEALSALGLQVEQAAPLAAAQT